jgi:hypothetical protein
MLDNETGVIIDSPEYKRKVMFFDMHDPIYGNKVFLNSYKVDMAERMNIPLLIKVPNGTALIGASEWKNGAEIMKKVFKFPNNPMILYGKHVPVPIPPAMKKGEIQKETNPNQLRLF